MNAREQRLAETFEALAAIRRRLSWSLRDDCDYFPVTVEIVASDDPDATRALDAFLQRFGQLLDQILRKLFPRLQTIISGDEQLLPVRELFENFHRAGIIDDIDAWRELIEVRNRLTHDYALDPLARAESLNDAWTRAPLLLDQVDRARAYVERHAILKSDKP